MFWLFAFVSRIFLPSRILSTLLISILLVYFIPSSYYSADSAVQEMRSIPQPVISDSKLRAEIVFTGLKSPTTMAFLGLDDILVLEKDNGTVRRIVNGQMQNEPVLDVQVANEWARGMLGIAIAKNSTTGITYVFLYYTESGGGKDGDDECPKRHCKADTEPLGNRLYRYELKNNKLVDPKLFLDLPATPESNHNGGPVIVGPDNNVYVVVGDLTYLGKVISNNKTGDPPDGRAGILRVSQNGEIIDEGLIGNTYPLNLYYAYGIRNSFGMDFDPVTGNLWDTENGPAYGDEINLVKPGFNSGWMKVHGIWEPKDAVDKDKLTAGEIFRNPDALVTFEGKGKYASPAFTWFQVDSPTALKFLNSNNLGEDYTNNMFVASTSGKIYHFKLNEKRTGLDLKGSLLDKIADTREELDNITFGKDFDAISDLEVGPDHNLYVVSYPTGTIFRIVPSMDTKYEK